MSERERDHTRFVQHLNDSKHGVWLVANWLNEKQGLNVTVNASSVSKGYEDRMDHVDSGDLYISQRVEVKSLSAEFTGKHDWPFKDQLIVCAKHSYDNATPKPYMYVLLNKAKTHAIIIMGRDHGKWTVKKYNDKRYENMTQDFYIAKADDVTFIKL
jgi:hypothetical protein